MFWLYNNRLPSCSTCTYQVRERKVEKIPKVIYEEKETWITKPVIRQVEKKRTIKVPR